jgi:uncharacterized membrane protein
MDAIREAIQSFILNMFGGWALAEEMCVLLCSMLPIIELRGAIPMAAAFNIDWWIAFPLCVIGNMLPVPFIIRFFRPIINYFKNTKAFGKMATRLHERSMKKSENVTKYKMFGLFLFVALPIPGTGAWTGSAIAALLNMRIKHALPTVLLGVLCAGILMMGLSYGFGALFTHLFA